MVLPSHVFRSHNNGFWRGMIWDEFGSKQSNPGGFLRDVFVGRNHRTVDLHGKCIRCAPVTTAPWRVPYA